jgi:adenylate kinase
MPDRAPAVVLLGPPGSGKGTQGTRLARALGVDHVSTGDLLRASIAAGDPHAVAGIMRGGALVPDEVLERVLLDTLPPGFVLDGYPRSAYQAAALDRALAPNQPDGVLELTVPEEVLLPRLLARAVKHRRADDTPETIARRFEVYRNEIGSLREYYGDRLVTVDGVGTLSQVFERLRGAAGPGGTEG